MTVTSTMTVMSDMSVTCDVTVMSDMSVTCDVTVMKSIAQKFKYRHAQFTNVLSPPCNTHP